MQKIQEQMMETPPLVTGGTASAYTLDTGGVGTLTHGQMLPWVAFHAVNDMHPTLDVDGNGPLPIRLTGAENGVTQGAVAPWHPVRLQVIDPGGSDPHYRLVTPVGRVIDLSSASQLHPLLPGETAYYNQGTAASSQYFNIAVPRTGLVTYDVTLFSTMSSTNHHTQWFLNRASYPGTLGELSSWHRTSDNALGTHTYLEGFVYGPFSNGEWLQTRLTVRANDTATPWINGRTERYGWDGTAGYHITTYQYGGPGVPITDLGHIFDSRGNFTLHGSVTRIV